MDEKKLRLYKFLLEMERTTIDSIPEPYKTALTQSETETEATQ